MSARILLPSQYEMLTKLDEAQRALKYWKAEEWRLRQICTAGLGDPTKTEGTESLLLDNGWTAKIVKTLNYNLKNSNKETVTAELLLPDDLGAEMFRWKPELSISTYKKAAPEWKAIIEPALTITVGAPTFELSPPTADKVI
jgi:hypothetical protein